MSRRQAESALWAMVYIHQVVKLVTSPESPRFIEAVNRFVDKSIHGYVDNVFYQRALSVWEGEGGAS